jgi:hypothetical protein
MKTEDDRNKLASTIQEYAPASWEYEYANECYDYCATPGPLRVTEYYIRLQFFSFNKIWNFLYEVSIFEILCCTLFLEGAAYQCTI